MSTNKTNGSLISESLAQLYRRMAKAFRAPTPPDAVAVAQLSRVIELHHCAVAMIQAAMEHSDTDGRELLEELSGEQTRLAHAVGELVSELGGSPPRLEESSERLPHGPRAMGRAHDQTELMAYVHEDLDSVVTAQLELASFSEIPFAMRQRIEELLCCAIAEDVSPPANELENG